MGSAQANGAIRRMGWVNGLTYLLMRALHRASAGRARLIKYDLLVQPLGHTRPLCKGRGKDLEVREMSPHEADVVGLLRDPATIAFRADQGARCLGVLRNDELLGVLWYKAGSYQEDEVRCLFLPSPEDQAVWDFDVYITPRERWGMAFAKLWDETCRHLAEQGYHYTCSRISAFNPASRSAHERIGARIVGKATFLCIGPWQAMVSTVKPHVHVSFHEKSRPSIPVGPPHH